MGPELFLTIASFTFSVSCNGRDPESREESGLWRRRGYTKKNPASNPTKFLRKPESHRNGKKQLVRHEKEAWKKTKLKKTTTRIGSVRARPVQEDLSGLSFAQNLKYPL